jgi:hypothetical protein
MQEYKQRPHVDIHMGPKNAIRAPLGALMGVRFRIIGDRQLKVRPGASNELSPEANAETTISA